MIPLAMTIQSVLLASKDPQGAAVAQSLGFLGGECPPWRPFPSPFLGEVQHRIALFWLRQELSRIGPLYVPHGDLVGYTVLENDHCEFWPAHMSQAVSFPASILIGPDPDDIPF